MSPEPAVLAAVDLGASSGRVIAGVFDGERTRLRIIHRFPNAPVRVNGTLYWDVLGLYRGILDGLRATSAAYGGVTAIGVDGWAVDYALLANDGSMLGQPVHYRDERTTPIVADLLARVGAPQLFDATGIAVQPFNTLFQLGAEICGPRFESAARLLLVPDLAAYWLSGEEGTELTNASTTGLLDARTQRWSAEMAALVPGAVDALPAVAPTRHDPRPGTHRRGRRRRDRWEPGGGHGAVARHRGGGSGHSTIDRAASVRMHRHLGARRNAAAPADHHRRGADGRLHQRAGRGRIDPVSA